jgi:hypothetical protein
MKSDSGAGDRSAESTLSVHDLSGETGVCHIQLSKVPATPEALRKLPVTNWLD